MLCRRAAKRRAENGGELAAAERRRDPERIVEHGGVTGERAVDDRALAREAFVVDAGAAAGPARAAAAEQRRRDGRRRRGVADAHLAEADEIGLRRHGIVARPRLRREIAARSSPALR